MKLARSTARPTLSRTASSLDRRELLRRMCLGLAALPLLQLACSEDGASGVDGSAGGDAASGQPDGAGANGDAATASGWASGGTEAMTGKDSYPDPFATAVGSCALVASTTEGPCTTATDLAREDVSEGWTGLPVRFALKVVDGDCNPVAGATVKIWHTNLEGVYSGNTPNPGMCSGNDQEAIAADFFRGVQTTAADGTVYFDTCFPGWYSGRAVHIHFQVKSGSTSYRVSQLFFPEAITTEIFASHPEYSGFGQPNTTFANDNIVGGIASSELDDLVLTVARMSDGAMLASKIVTVVA
jgi:protocatechuate 3,4-dioxygenase beta subunit